MLKIYILKHGRIYLKYKYEINMKVADFHIFPYNDIYANMCLISENNICQYMCSHICSYMYNILWIYQIYIYYYFVLAPASTKPGDKTF